MTPVSKTVAILVASGAVVAGSLLLTQAPRSAVTPAAALAASGDNVFLSATPESTHILRGAGETHIAISVKAPNAATKKRPPVSVAIVLDRSGSMEGEKLAQAKRAAAELISKLDENDHFSVTVYGTDVETVVTLRRADSAAVAEAHRAIESIEDHGGTNLSGGLVEGSVQLNTNDGTVRRIVLISDGKANSGLRSQAELANLAAETAKTGISITTVGVGLDFDEKKMTAIAIAGRGNYYFAERASDLSSMFATELGRVTATAATDVSVTLDPAAGVEILEAYGHKLEGGTVQLADLHAGETRRVIYRVRARYGKNGEFALGTARLKLHWLEADKTREESVALNINVTDDHHAVTRGQDADVVAMVERARTAVTLQQATELYERGDATGARRMMRVRQAEAVKRAQAVGSKGLEKEMDAFGDGAAESFAPAPMSDEGKSSRKKNRAKSYELLH